MARVQGTSVVYLLEHSSHEGLFEHVNPFEVVNLCLGFDSGGH